MLESSLLVLDHSSADFCPVQCTPPQLSEEKKVCLSKSRTRSPGVVVTMPLNHPRARGYSSSLSDRLSDRVGRSRSRVRDSKDQGGSGSDIRQNSGRRYHSRDSYSSMRMRPRPLSPPGDLSYRPAARGIRLPPSRGRSSSAQASPEILLSPREWPSALGVRRSRPRFGFGESPPLSHSLDGRPDRDTTAAAEEPSLPPGVVNFPTGKKLASFIQTDVGDLRSKEFRAIRKYEEVPEDGDSAGEPAIANFRVELEVVPRISFTRDQLAMLHESFRILRPRFPVRCRYKACSVLRGPCREAWANMITIPGMFLFFFFQIFLSHFCF